MHHTPDTPQAPPNTSPPVAPPEPTPGRARLVKVADTFIGIQPIWGTLATLFVYLSYLLDLGVAFPWIGLALAFLPFPLRLARSGFRGLRTAFDVPILLLVIGAIGGYSIAANQAISLGALQCMFAATLFYYSWVNSPLVANHVKGIVTLLALVFLPLFVFLIVDVSLVDGQPSFDIRGSGTHHGLAMYLAIEVAILLGMAAFDKSKRIRVFAIVLSVLFLVIIAVMTRDSLVSLFHGRSVEGRWPIWERTADLLSDSPLTGLGLGCWALTYWGTASLGNDTVAGITHAHNAYIELYCNVGILGAVALLLALGIGVKLSLDIIRSPRNHPWYGFGVGVILACISTLLVAFVESAPVGVPLVALDTYYYVVSPIAWVLCGLLAIAHRHITKSPGS